MKINNLILRKTKRQSGVNKTSSPLLLNFLKVDQINNIKKMRFKRGLNMSKKGRNPGTVDNWLESLGFYRKNVAYDETCLFRATSEQIFDCQIFHEKVRMECIQYARENVHEFYNLMKSEEDFLKHLNMLEKHMVICGNTEIQIISKKYKRDVMLFDPIARQLYNVTNTYHEKALYFCIMGEDHYDVVYKKDHIVNAGFCQSIVYNCLYEKVFEIPEVVDIVDKMLYGKEFVTQSIEANNLKLKNDELGPPQNIAPFPFKVAKALDPTIYRNIEYDSWTEVRREMRLGEWYYGDDKLILGTRCIFTNEENDETFDCYIQEIIKEENKCVVYITKLAERRTVNYSDLQPENDAKPWPLPYRFSKNLSFTPPLTPSPNDKKYIKKKKDKKRNKNDTNNTQITQTERQDSPPTNVNPFIGAPLQMQPPENFVSTPQQQQHETQNIITENSELSVSEHNLLVTPETPMPKFQWDTQWQNYSNEQIVWPQPPSTTPQFSYRPIIASAPATPGVANYYDAYSFNNYYDCNNNNNNNNQSWNNSPDIQANNDIHFENIKKMDVEQHDNNNNNNQEIDEYNNIKQENPSAENLTNSTNLNNPFTQPMEMFSPIRNGPQIAPIPIHPGTPVVYATSMPTTPIQMYTPPIEMQYITSPPFIYPPTPPTAWYPPGVNAQGFIFPAAYNRN